MQEHQEVQIDETDDLEERRTPLWRDRLFVCAFLLSVCACLVALWFSGILVSAPPNQGWLTVPSNATPLFQSWAGRIIASAPNQGWPASFLQFVTMHRWLVLLIPAVCLLGCYGVLRSLTGEITAVPERHLDERQQMLRNQAHRSSFKLIKLACILIPACFLLLHLPGLNTAPTTPGPYYTLMGAYQFRPIIITYLPLDNKVTSSADWQAYQLVTSGTTSPINKLMRFASVIQPGDGANLPMPPVTTADIVLAGGLLLLCLWLLISALPMCVLAWQGRR